MRLHRGGIIGVRGDAETRMRRVLLTLGAAMLALVLARPAAEFELSLNSGYRTGPHSRVSDDYPGGGTYDALFG
jgi:lipid A oxidase